MSKLRKSAKGEECLMRLPGVCSFDPETVVLCHLRDGSGGKMGGKSSDICSVYACAACHDKIDRRTQLGSYTPHEIDSYILDGHMRTLMRFLEKGLIKIV